MRHPAAVFLFAGLTAAIVPTGNATGADLELNELEYFEMTGVNFLVFSNWYDGLFSDSKISGIELVHHGVRTATNGDVRVDATPEQWDRIPEFVEKKVDRRRGTVEAFLRYPDLDFDYAIRAEAQGDALRISVRLAEPLPAELVGKAGFNLEFLPSAYFGRSWIMDEASGLLPLHPTGVKEQNDKVLPTALARGTRLVLAAEDRARRVTISAGEGELALFDGRNKAQNGWFVVRGLLPGGRTGAVLDGRCKPVRRKLVARTGHRPFAGRLPPGAGKNCGDRTRSRRPATGHRAARPCSPGWLAGGRPGSGAGPLGTIQAL